MSMSDLRRNFRHSHWMEAIEKLSVAWRSNLGSVASMHRKNRSSDARANAGALNTGWYGWGRRFRAHMPTNAASAAPRTVVSKVIGMKYGQL